jgi:mono/diheme cytochrome c family protein
VRPALAAAAAVVAFGSWIGLAAAAGGDQGQKVFRSNCTSCHTVIAEGSPAIKALVAKYHGVHMPNLGLSAADIDALVAYLETQAKAGGATTTTTTAPATGAPKGDAAAGKDLFTGATALAHGGAACISCHSISGAGALGGGKVGPDLTTAYERYGGAKGLVSVLSTISFPTMVPVYKGHALTGHEAASLAAYLATPRDAKASNDRTWPLVAIGAAVTVGLLALALLLWPRRRHLDVRRRLVADAVRHTGGS